MRTSSVAALEVTRGSARPRGTSKSSLRDDIVLDVTGHKPSPLRGSCPPVCPAALGRFVTGGRHARCSPFARRRAQPAVAGLLSLGAPAPVLGPPREIPPLA